MMRREIEEKGRNTVRAADHERSSPPERVGERSGGHVRQENHDEEGRQHAVDLELVQPARSKEQWIDAVKKPVRKRIHPPHGVVTAHDPSNRSRSRALTKNKKIG